MPGIVWLSDRASGIVGYAVLYLAVLSGVFYSPRAARRFGAFHDLARRTHVELAVLALIVIAIHAVVGIVDTAFVATGVSPVPSYGLLYLFGGVVVGVGALLLICVAVLGFLDPRRFQRPWDARTVHLFAYGGFAFATVHVVAIGSDVTGFVQTGVVVAFAFVLYAVVTRALVNYGGAMWDRLAAGRSG